MSWSQITEENKDSFMDLLHSVDPCYSKVEFDQYKDGHVFLYDGGSFHIINIWRWFPDRNKWRLSVSMPVGEFDPTEAAAISVAQFRDFIDKQEVKQWFTKPKEKYKNPKLDEYVRLCISLLPEIEEETIKNGSIKLSFNMSSNANSNK